MGSKAPFRIIQSINSKISGNILERFCVFLCEKKDDFMERIMSLNERATIFRNENVLYSPWFQRMHVDC